VVATAAVDDDDVAMTANPIAAARLAFEEAPSSEARRAHGPTQQPQAPPPALPGRSASFRFASVEPTALISPRTGLVSPRIASNRRGFAAVEASGAAGASAVLAPLRGVAAAAGAHSDSLSAAERSRLPGQTMRGQGGSAAVDGSAGGAVRTAAAAAAIAAASRSRSPAADSASSATPRGPASKPSPSPTGGRDSAAVPKRAASVKLMKAAVAAASATEYVGAAARARNGPKVASGWSQRNVLDADAASTGTHARHAPARGSAAADSGAGEAAADCDDGMLVRDFSTRDLLELATPRDSRAAALAAFPAASSPALPSSDAAVSPPTRGRPGGLAAIAEAASGDEEAAAGARSAGVAAAAGDSAVPRPADAECSAAKPEVLRVPSFASTSPEGRAALLTRLQSSHRQPSMRALVLVSPTAATAAEASAGSGGTAPGVVAGAGAAGATSARPGAVDRRSTLKTKPSLSRLLSPPIVTATEGGESGV
jgi:hypothetical protein